MAASVSIEPSVTSLLQKSFPSVDTTESDPCKISSSVYPDAHYTDAEKNDINQWTITASHISSATSGSVTEDAAKTAARFSSLNTHLASRTTILGSKPSLADVALFTALSPIVSKWSANERTGEQGYHHIVRHIDFVQNSPLFGLKVAEEEKVAVDPNDVKVAIKPIDAKAEKERKKKEKEAATAAAAAGATTTSAADAPPKSKKEKVKDAAASVGTAVASAVGVGQAGTPKDSTAAPAADEDGAKSQKTQKKEKKEKAPKPPKAAAVEKPLSPSLIDLRVGHIIKAVQHPNADSLYVSTIACGDAAGADNTSDHEGTVVRTVCSGLNGLIPLEEMQGAKIVVVCNLKPVTMRGIKSAAMVLAASPRPKEGEDGHHTTPVELVRPPEGAEPGDRVYFEGWEGDPEPVLNPKKKVWETVQPGFTTTDGLEVAFDAGAVEPLAKEGKSGLGVLKTKGGVCKVTTLQGATVR
ncbi:nucleic acid-binding protein [Aulographum hederae CBS 113979]|uniref:Nucleic acid-binding protein n=1 Tax=Aulographum hederae CBS 113979 TaxID=1176131 RepID=A0A6G1GVZ4_9PEZI|nr:nucleic acid-binding protein [Aulographum hederae CBS 113979]